MNWTKLLSAKRLGLEDYHSHDNDNRTEFQRDYDRIIFSSSFRRLQNKTQVFPLPQRIYVHNRLTHSLEVASVGRSLGNIVSKGLIQNGETTPLVEELGSIVAASCLVHDIGNPPFGHSGEKVISSFFIEGNGKDLLKHFDESQQADLKNFEGNANAFRLLTQQFVGKRQGGFVLTYSTLAATVKYPYSSLLSQGKKFGFFQSEEAIFQKIALELGLPQADNGMFQRHPLVYLVEAADDICYQVMDVEDAFKLGILSIDETKTIYLRFFHHELDAKTLASISRTMLRVEDKNEQISYLRGMVIGKLVKECSEVFVANEQSILAGQFEGSLIKNISEHTRMAYQKSSEIAFKRIYRSQEVLEIELAGFKIINTLMEIFCEAVCYPQKAYSKQILYFIPSQFRMEDGGLYQQIRGVIDFISGMTDLYALDLYRKIMGISLPGMS